LPTSWRCALVVLDQADREPTVASALAEVVKQVRSPFGPADSTRQLLRDVHERVCASLPALLAPLLEAAQPRVTELRLQVLDLDHETQDTAAAVSVRNARRELAEAYQASTSGSACFAAGTRPPRRPLISDAHSSRRADA